MYRALRLCSQGGGFEAIPDPPRTLDLLRIRASLEAAGIPILDARVMLIASLPPEVTISRSGRLLFKTPDEEVARRAFQRLMDLADLADASPTSPPRPTP
jgi:hypothetical protein